MPLASRIDARFCRPAPSYRYESQAHCLCPSRLQHFNTGADLRLVPLGWNLGRAQELVRLSGRQPSPCFRVERDKKTITFKLDRLASAGQESSSTRPRLWLNLDGFVHSLRCRTQKNSRADASGSFALSDLVPTGGDPQLGAQRFNDVIGSAAVTPNQSLRVGLHQLALQLQRRSSSQSSAPLTPLSITPTHPTTCPGAIGVQCSLSSPRGSEAMAQPPAWGLV